MPPTSSIFVTKISFSFKTHTFRLDIDYVSQMMEQQDIDYYTVLAPFY